MSVNVNWLDEVVYVNSTQDGVVYVTKISNNEGNPNIQFQDEGTNIGTPGAVSTIDFVGTSVSLALVGGKLTVTITGGGGGGSWGSITGTLSDQTDLQNALDLKATIASVNLKIDKLFTTYTKTNDYTLLAADLADINVGKRLMFEMDKATAINFIVPNDETVEFDVGTVIGLRRIAAGTLTLVAGPTVTLTSVAGDLTDPGQYVDFYIEKTAANTWIVQNGFNLRVITVLPLYANATNLVSTNQPAGVQSPGATSLNIRRFDLTNYTQIKLSIRVVVAGAATANQSLWYTTNLSAINWVEIGSGTGDNVCSYASTGFGVETAWMDIPAGAKTDVLLGTFEQDGNAAADPATNNIVVYIR